MSITGIGEVADFAKTIVDKIWPNAEQKQKDDAAFLIMQTTREYDLVQGQIEVNKAEATNTNWFVAGWRPFIGWICGTGLAYQFLVYPVLVAFIPKIQQLDVGTLMTLLLGMLGIGSMRTYEKLKGKAK